MPTRPAGTIRSSIPAEHLTDHFGLVSDFLSECWSRCGREIAFRSCRDACISAAHSAAETLKQSTKLSAA